MNIVHITPYKIIPANTGGERGVYFPLCSLNKKCKLVTLTVKENVENAPFQVAPIFSSSVSRYANPFMLLKIKTWIKKQQAEVLYIEHPFIAWHIAIFKNILGVPLVIRSHNIEYVRFKTQRKFYWPVIKMLEKYVHRRADYSLFVTEEDRRTANKDFGVSLDKALFMPYGVTLNQLPNKSELAQAREYVEGEHKISTADKIILFNGSLGYQPNEKAVEEIIDNLLPSFLKAGIKEFKIVICGKGLRNDLSEKILGLPNIILTGFVPDIDVYYKACDIFINPVVEGGGVKTKLVEALGFGKPVVTYYSGSFGVEPTITNGRLQIIKDYESDEFAKVCIALYSKVFDDDNSLFYKAHNWDNIVDKSLVHLNKTLFNIPKT